MIRILPLGGAGEIGASCFYLNIDGSGIILDCGVHPQRTGLESLPKFDLIKDESVDYVLISHAHQDHLSALPYLVQRHPYIKIETTPQTRALAELILHNSVSILREQLSEEDAMKVYSHEEVDLLIKTIGYKSYEEVFNINGYKHKGGSQIYASFYDAGHILGSAGILIKYDGKNLFYTGDVNLNNQALIQGAKLPGEKIDTLILESTYGATNSNDFLPSQKEIERLIKSINQIINDGGSILIPVFALGKMQEMLKILWDFMRKGRLVQVDIYSGGLGDEISYVYDYNRYVVNMVEPDFELKSIPRKNIYDVTNPNDFFKSPGIVLASSGMILERTVSFKLAKEWLKQKQSAIFTVGYIDKNTPGYKIVNAQKGEKIKLTEYSEEIEVKCTVEQFKISAHSKREDLLKLVKKLKPDKVILIHGDADSINWMGASILKNFKGTKVFAADIGKEIVI